MEALITQFEALKTQFFAFEDALRALEPESPSPIIGPRAIAWRDYVLAVKAEIGAKGYMDAFNEARRRQRARDPSCPAILLTAPAPATTEPLGEVTSVPPVVAVKSSVITQQAKEAAKAAIQARIEQKLARFNAPETVRLPIVYKHLVYRSRAQFELMETERRINRIEAERAIRRMRPSKLDVAVAQVRLDNPDLKGKDLYREAHRLLKQPPPLTKFQAVCAEVRKMHPTMPEHEVYMAARMRLKVKACAPGLAALNN
jgi:hypothetical protein